MEEEWGGAEARPRMAVEPGMVVKEEAEDGDSSKTEWWTQGDRLK